jgi:transposase-like protein
MRDVIRYGGAFKLRLAEEAAAGKYRSLDEAGRRNGIRGGVTLKKWIKQYGREDMLPKRIKVETVKEIDEPHEARRRIREPEAALANAHMDYCLESAFLDIARKRLGTGTEELKKKERYNACRAAKDKGDSMKIPVAAGQWCQKLGMR